MNLQTITIKEYLTQKDVEFQNEATNLLLVACSTAAMMTAEPTNDIYIQCRHRAI